MALDGRAVDGHDGVGRSLVGIEPARGEGERVAFSSEAVGGGFGAQPTQTCVGSPEGSPHKRVAFVRENSDLHDLAEGGEGLSHQLLWETTRTSRHEYFPEAAVNLRGKYQLGGRICEEVKP